MDACYYSLIRRAPDAQLVGWIPDLPGVTASGTAEEDILRDLSRVARALLAKILSKGLAPPEPSQAVELPLADHVGRYRRMLLILS
jgi:predicted RNase H-like HicB family nuclease